MFYGLVMKSNVGWTKIVGPSLQPVFSDAGVGIASLAILYIFRRSISFPVQFFSTWQ